MAVRANDPLLEPVAEKVAAGERLTREDALRLFQTSDLLGVGAMANLANQRLNNNRVFFSANQHINPTNVCILR
ncbi:MAG: aminofutalosine synthase MqnE, partial [Gemmatimonadetes bacterium]|nr:aminofutalosine synthase MqnE [Gemmatimonadota bacterium]